MTYNRRNFLKHSMASAAGMTAAGLLPADLFAQGLHSTSMADEILLPAENRPKLEQSIKFAVIGINHSHIYGIVDAVKDGGGVLCAVYSAEPELLPMFRKKYPEAKVVQSEKEILEDNTIQLVASAGIPIDRAPLGIRVMKAGKDYVTDKPGIITFKQFEEVKKVQKATGRIYSILYSERLRNQASVQAGNLIKAGAIGRVIQTIGLGPHRMNPSSRPPWFFDPEKAGGILTDIGSHQCDQFLFFTNSQKATVNFSQIANFNTSNYPAYQDFGDMSLRSDHATGYIRIDWFTPQGLATWGDGRTFILGTDGYIELRKFIDIAGRPKENHLFLVNQKETQYYDCNNVYMPYGEQLVSDILHRTETAMTQEHCFHATELALTAQKKARKIIG
ncbi:MAG: Gfo/Idh/MocA family oxidoreductase [Marinilabiliales bacterium]|nr:Gfo/Idh/MocA family oxidoreductase [Marinilabiliales bacterium]